MKSVYRSKIDWWAWGILVFTLAVLYVCAISTEWYITAIYGIGLIGMELAGLFGVWYTVEGDTLTVYNYFRPLRVPISKISEIRYCRGYLAGAAMSRDRLSIRFTDRNVLKSFMPLEISPKNRDAFVEDLLKVNPDINVVRQQPIS